MQQATDSPEAKWPLDELHIYPFFFITVGHQRTVVLTPSGSCYSALTATLHTVMQIDKLPEH